MCWQDYSTLEPYTYVSKQWRTTDQTKEMVNFDRKPRWISWGDGPTLTYILRRALCIEFLLFHKFIHSVYKKVVEKGMALCECICACMLGPVWSIHTHTLQRSSERKVYYSCSGHGFTWGADLYIYISHSYSYIHIYIYVLECELASKQGWSTRVMSDSCSERSYHG